MSMRGRIRSCAESILQEVESYDEPLWGGIRSHAAAIIAALDAAESPTAPKGPQ